MKHLRTIFILSVLLALALATLPATSVSATGICFVDADAVGTNDGTSWADAYTDLQSALGASPCTEVWVAAGTYKPTTGIDRTATFQLKDGVGVYGGFAGTETAREQRDWTANVTVLSGDIDNNDSQTPIITDLTTVTGNTTNSYHVVIGNNIDSIAVLDGFTITAGLANDAGNGSGGGLYNSSGSPTLANVTFSGNQAGDGGGLYNSSGNPTLANVTFSGNQAGRGGGMYNFNGNPTLTDITFSGNSVNNSGGGMDNENSNPTLTNVTFSGNSANSRGGGMYNYDNSSPMLTNITFSGNSSDDAGGGMSNYYSNPTLTNVTFNGNSAINSGGGMYNDHSSPTLTSITFSGNQAASGGGMLNWCNSSPTLTNASFSDNQAEWGGGMYNYSVSNPTLTNVTFSGNQASAYGGGMANTVSHPTLTNVTFSGNQASGSGGGMFNALSNPILTNVTISGNQAVTGGGGIHNNNSSAPLLQNTILWGNQNGSGSANLENEPLSIPIIRYSLVAGCNPGGVWNSACGIDGNNNLADSDPLFVAPEPASSAPTTAGDYRLQDASPAINKGDNAADLDGSGPLTTTIRSIPQDLDGNPRFVRVFIDLGAYENQTLQCPAGGVLYVDKDATGLETGESWNNAFVTLQDALYVTESCEIWVAAGTYKPTTGTDRTATFQLKEGVGVYGGFVGIETVREQRDWTANVTILNGDLNGDDSSDFSYFEPTRADNSYHVVTGATDATLDGITITAGNANDDISPLDGTGGGMYNSSNNLTLMNVTFSRNSANWGGGMRNYWGNPTLTNVTFDRNSAASGGGLYNNGNSTLTNVIFSNNGVGHAGGGMTNGSGDPMLKNVIFYGNFANNWGGGMYNTGVNWGGNPILVDVTFTGNVSTLGGGGMFNETSSPILTNITFSGNPSHQGGGMYNSNSSPTLTNVTFIGNNGDLGGGGMYEKSSASMLTNVTFRNNTAGDYGGGIYNLSNSNPQIRNTIFWGNTAGVDGAQIYNYDDTNSPVVSDSVVQGGYTGTNIIITDPKLGALGFYGGFTQTIPLLPGSSAIDATSNNCPTTDQRGETRSIPNCDIGAFESQGFSLAVSGGNNQSAQINHAFTNPLVVGVMANNAVEPVNGGLVTFTAPVSGASAVLTGSPATILSGSASVTATANGTSGAYQVSASASGGSTVVNFNLTNTTIVTFRSVGANDGWILESTENSGLGGMLDSTATTFRLGDDAAKKQYRSILSFNTGARLPDDAVILKVTLKVKRQGVTGGGNPVTMFQGFMVDIKRGVFGTTALQASDFQAKANKSYGPFKPTLFNGWYSIDLTGGKAYINKLATLSGLTQIRLRFQLDDNNNAIANYLSLFSGNAPAASCPQLIVEYYVPVP